MGIKTRLGALALAGLMGMWASPAGAVGPPVERFDGIYANCDGLGDVFLVGAPSHAGLTPAFVLDSGEVLVPFSITETQTFTPTGGSPQTSTETFTRRAPRNVSLTECTASGHFVAPEGSYDVHIDAQVLVLP